MRTFGALTLSAGILGLWMSTAHAAEFGNDNCIVDEGVVTEVRTMKENLRKKEAQLTEWESELKRKEAALSEQMSKLEELRKDVEKTRQVSSKENQETVAKLVETFEKMSPKASAKLLAELDEHLAVVAMSKMNTGTLAKVMSNMEPSKSTQLSELMALGHKTSSPKGSGKK